jgi:predicted RNA-binding protein
LNHKFLILTTHLLALEADPTILRTPAPLSKKRKRNPPVVPDETELDRLLIATMEAGKDDSKKPCLFSVQSSL